MHAKRFSNENWPLWCKFKPILTCMSYAWHSFTFTHIIPDTNCLQETAPTTNDDDRAMYNILWRYKKKDLNITVSIFVRIMQVL